MLIGFAYAALLLLLSSAATGSSAEPGAEFGPLLFGLALLVIAEKAGELLAGRGGQPPVLGELLFGILLANSFPLFSGGSGIEFVRSNDTLRFLAEVGVLILLFDVGLEADLRAFVRVGVSAV